MDIWIHAIHGVAIIVGVDFPYEVFDAVVKLDALVVISFLTFAFIVHPNLMLS